MDKIVRRVTVVEHSGHHREANTVYSSTRDDEDEDTPHFSSLERSIRHMLKAQVIASQEAYQRHLDSAAKGGNAWLQDGPGNMMRARRKAMKEARRSSPFGSPARHDLDDEED